VAAPAPGTSNVREVIAEALTRDRAKLEGIVRRRFPDLDAADIVQRAAVRALERCDELRDVERVPAWLARIAVTSAIDVARGPARREISTENVPEVDVVQPTADETCACTIGLLEKLPAAYADMLRRVDVGDESLDDVAHALDIEKGNAAVRLHRARRALRDRLREHCGVENARACLTCTCSERGCCGT